MKVVLVGAPGSGKTGLVDALVEQGVYAHPDAARVIESQNIAIGQLSDYRTEMYIAAGRAHVPARSSEEITVFTHSLLDSIAYATVRLANMIRFQSVDEGTQDKWWLVSYLTGSMIGDGFTADHVLFLPGHIEEAGEFHSQLEINLEEVLTYLEIPYTKIDSNGASAFEQAAKLFL